MQDGRAATVRRVVLAAAGLATTVGQRRPPACILRGSPLASAAELQRLGDRSAAPEALPPLLATQAAYRTPRDKLVCVLNCCKRINSSLSVTSAGSHGADEFFPVLIFVLLQARDRACAPHQ